MTYDKEAWIQKKKDNGTWLCPELYELVKEQRKKNKDAWIQKQKDEGKWLPLEEWIKQKDNKRKREDDDENDERAKEAKILKPHSDVLDITKESVVNTELIFDTETTGLGREHKIIEISLIEIIDGIKTGRTYHSFFNPVINISIHATKVHKITNEDVKDAPLFADKAEEIIKFIGTGTLVAHNAKFDMGKLNKELYDAGWELYETERFIDTLGIARHLFPGQGNKQDDLCERFKIDNSKRLEDGHSAIEDTILLYHVYLKLIELLKEHDLTPHDFRL
jgi:DNA polymerase-3 subunit epsilon